jgi:hypothetical protein
MNVLRKITTMIVTIGALIAAVPAAAGIGVIYYSDYPGGTQIGGALQDDCGSAAWWGYTSDIYYYAYVSVPCGSPGQWAQYYGNVYYTPWGPGWPH